MIVFDNSKKETPEMNAVYRLFSRMKKTENIVLTREAEDFGLNIHQLSRKIATEVKLPELIVHDVPNKFHGIKFELDVNQIYS